MLEAYLTKSLGKRAQVLSAGVEASGVDPQAVRIMAEDGFVIAGQTSKTIEEIANFNPDRIIYCSEDLISADISCAADAKKHCAHFTEITGFGGGERLQAMRNLREEIKSYAQKLISTLSD